ncbi:MAG: peptidylprolyl isomerase [Gemmatimonadales bacterium]
MRRTSMVVSLGLAVVVSGCGIFAAHSDVIESAAGQKFTSQRLADLLLSVKAPIPFDIKTGELLTNMWTDMTLFAQAVAENKLKIDSASVAEAMWPVIQNVIYSRWMDTVINRKAKITDAAIDSAYNADQMRAVQHILVQADSGAPADVKAAALKKIQGYLAQIKAGESFSKLAYEKSEDPGSRPDSGYYGPKQRGTYVAPFEKALYSLKPGEMSGIVTTSYGYHIIRRPTEKESARFWRDTLSASLSEQIQNAYFAEMVTKNHIKVDGGASARIRTAIDNLDGHRNDHATLATYDGGTFSTADFVRWLGAYTADVAQGAPRLAQIKATPDSDLVKVLQAMTAQSLMLKEASQNGVKLSPDEWKAMETGFAATVDSMKVMLGLTPQALDPKASAADRSRAAAEKVDQFFNDMMSEKTQWHALPGILSVSLRAQYKPGFSAVALQHGIDIAQRQHAADSVKAAANGAAGVQNLPTPPGGLQPGGPPPVGGDTAKGAAPIKKP